MLCPDTNEFLPQFTQRDNWVANSYSAESANYASLILRERHQPHQYLKGKQIHRFWLKPLKQLGLLL